MESNKLFKLVEDRLKNITPEYKIETEIILNKLFNLNKIDFIIPKNIDYKAKEPFLDEIIIRREKREPLQYIFNEQNFMGYNFYINENVLIPRSDTEILVEKAIELIKSFNEENNIKILDLGTGSGCITISLANEFENIDFFALDISEKALEVTNKNIKKLARYNNINLIQSDKFNYFKDKNIKFNLIISNPPYIPKRDFFNLEPEVKNYEPTLALVGDENNGTYFYEYIALEAPNYLKNNSYILCEIGINQKELINNIFNKYKKVEFFNDYNNIPRVILANYIKK
ncbi:MAG: peptide chain release factor N(5)-glutamine methyltransferase [Candidatus Sericytochromatia bacterium]